MALSGGKSFSLVLQDLSLFPCWLHYFRSLQLSPVLGLFPSVHSACSPSTLRGYFSSFPLFLLGVSLCQALGESQLHRGFHLRTHRTNAKILDVSRQMDSSWEWGNKVSGTPKSGPGVKYGKKAAEAYLCSLFILFPQTCRAFCSLISLMQL